MEMQCVSCVGIGSTEEGQQNHAQTIYFVTNVTIVYSEQSKRYSIVSRDLHPSLYNHRTEIKTPNTTRSETGLSPVEALAFPSTS